MVIFVLEISFVPGVFDIFFTSCFACCTEINIHKIFENILFTNINPHKIQFFYFAKINPGENFYTQNYTKVCGLMIPESHDGRPLLGKENPQAMAVGGTGTNNR